MPCVADGFPEPIITWYRGSNQISSDTSVPENSTRMVQMPITNILHISSLTLDDEGFYTCRASNVFSTVSATAQLTVTGTGTNVLF